MQPIKPTVIDELVRAKHAAKDTAAAFADAVKDQAKKHGVKKGALSKYISALASDKVEDVNAETGDLAQLLESH